MQTKEQYQSDVPVVDDGKNLSWAKPHYRCINVRGDESYKDSDQDMFNNAHMCNQARQFRGCDPKTLIMSESYQIAIVIYVYD